MSTDQDYIDGKKKEKGDSKTSDSSPDYIKWVTNVIKTFVYVLILFAVGAGAMANASNPKYHVTDEDGESFGNWPGTDVEGPPYCCPGETSTSSKNKSAKSAIKEFFDLTKFNTPYNLGEVSRLMANEIEINNINKNSTGDDELPEHLQPALDGRAAMYPWAIRMTSYSYAYMRKFFEAGLTGFFPRFNGESNWKTSLAFTLGGLLMVVIFILLHMLPLLFTIIGAISTLSSFAWVGWPGFSALCMPLLIPAILYILLLVLTPVITGMVNNFIQPYFYLGFMLEPIINNFKEIRKIMIAHAHIMALAGVIITVILAFTDAGNVPMFAVGVLIAACLVLAGAKTRKKDGGATSE